ncbi:MAG TPA: septal ring lytic transglycosylase RlpA family protein, partial [Nitrospirota bacterium]
PAPAVVDAVPPPASTQDRLCRETGIAGWYGKELHGKKTASGEVFDMHAISAAHRTLPLGTLVRVTNLDNFKSVKLRITDRGPFVRTRIMDLSQGAAKELGFIAQGSARVKIETLEMAPDNAPFTVLAAVFTEQENARLLKERLNKRFEVVTIVPFETNLATSYRVWVGSYASEERAEQVAAKLTLEGLEPMVTRKN